MLKKNLRIAGLIAALAVLFVGCLPQPEVEDTSGMDEFVVVDLKRAIVGHTGDASSSEDFGEKIGGGVEGFFTKAGDDAKFTITADGVEVNPAAYTWGAGLDLTDTGIQFRAGDKVYIKGKAVEAGEILLNTNHGGWAPLENWNPAQTAGAEFEHEFTLTAAEVGAIKGTSPKAIRVRRNNPATGKFVISELKVTGLRDKGFKVGPGGYSAAGPTPLCACTDPDCPCKANPTSDCGTEIFNSGVKECPECRPKDATSFTGGAGTYTVPTSSDPNVFYVDLGNINAGSAGKVINVDVVYTPTDIAAEGNTPARSANVKIESNKVTYYFVAENQPLALTLTSAQKTLVLDALKAGLYVDVEINAKATPRMGMRFGFADPTTGSNWNSANLVTSLFNDNTTAATLIKGRLTPNAAALTDAAPKTADTFLIQLREARKSALEINSVKVIIPSGVPVTVSELPADLAPDVGKTRKTTFETAQFTGAITWKVGSSAASESYFESNKQYVAEVTLTAKKWFTFKGGPAVFTLGGVSSQVSSYDADNSKVSLSFTFPATIIAKIFTGSIKVQSGTPTLADASSVPIGTTVTATYTPGVGDPAEADLKYAWQKSSGSVWVAVTGATGKTWVTNDIGTYRVVIQDKAEDYIPKESSSFEITSVAATGSLDAALNGTFVRTEGATKYWSFADWLTTSGIADGGTSQYGVQPLTVSNGGGTVTATRVGGGINITNRSVDGSCLVLVTNNWRYGQKGFSYEDTSGVSWETWDIESRKYKVTVYGFVISSIPSSGAVMKFQGDGGGGTSDGETAWGGTSDTDHPRAAYQAIGEGVTVTAADGSFKLVYEIPSDFIYTSNIRIHSGNPDVNFRVTLIEVEDLGAR